MYSAFLLLLALLCSASFAAAQTAPAPTDVQAFLKAAEARLMNLSIDAGRADWVKDTYITYDTEILAAKADERLSPPRSNSPRSSARFDQL